MEKRERVRRDRRRKDGGDRREDGDNRDGEQRENWREKERREKDTRERRDSDSRQNRDREPRQDDRPGKGKQNSFGNRPRSYRPPPPPAEKKDIDHTAIPDPHMFDNLKRETDEIAALTAKKYSKRQVFSNWAKYEKPLEVPSYEDEEEERRGGDFEVLLRGAQIGSHFKLKSETGWDSASSTLHNEIFSLNLNLIGSGLACIPFYEKMDLPTDMFPDEDMERMISQAKLIASSYDITKKDHIRPKLKRQDPDSSVSENELSIYGSDDVSETKANHPTPAASLTFDVSAPEPEDKMDFGFLPPTSMSDNFRKQHVPRNSPEKTVLNSSANRSSPFNDRKESANVSKQGVTESYEAMNGFRESKSPQVEEEYESRSGVLNPSRKSRSRENSEESAYSNDYASAKAVRKESFESQTSLSKTSTPEREIWNGNVQKQKTPEPEMSVGYVEKQNQEQHGISFEGKQYAYNEELNVKTRRHSPEPEVVPENTWNNEPPQDTESRKSKDREITPKESIIETVPLAENTDKEMGIKKRRGNRTRGGKGNKRKSGEFQAEEPRTAHEEEEETKAEVTRCKGSTESHVNENSNIGALADNMQGSRNMRTTQPEIKHIQKEYSQEREVPHEFRKNTWESEKSSIGSQKMSTPEPEIPVRNIEKEHMSQPDLSVTRTLSSELGGNEDRSVTPEPSGRSFYDKKVLNAQISETKEKVVVNERFRCKEDRRESAEKEIVSAMEVNNRKPRKSQTPEPTESSKVLAGNKQKAVVNERFRGKEDRRESAEKEIVSAMEVNDRKPRKSQTPEPTESSKALAGNKQKAVETKNPISVDAWTMQISARKENSVPEVKSQANAAKKLGKEDDQLDFLLSLKNPATEAPVSFTKPSTAVRSTIDEDDEKPKLSNMVLEKSAEDLEDWLDSMLDD